MSFWSDITNKISSLPVPKPLTPPNQVTPVYPTPTGKAPIVEQTTSFWKPIVEKVAPVSYNPIPAIQKLSSNLARGEQQFIAGGLKAIGADKPAPTDILDALKQGAKNVPKTITKMVYGEQKKNTPTTIGQRNETLTSGSPIYTKPNPTGTISTEQYKKEESEKEAERTFNMVISSMGGSGEIKNLAKDGYKAFRQNIAKDPNLDSVKMKLKAVGLDDININALAPDLSKAKTLQQVDDILINYERQGLVKAEPISTEPKTFWSEPIAKATALKTEENIAKRLTPEVKTNIVSIIDDYRLKGGKDLTLQQDASKIAEDLGIPMPKTYGALVNNLQNILEKADQYVVTPDSGLISEAKKYKSAEEFVKAQGEPIYHGTPYTFDEFKKGKTTFFTPDKKFAEGYGSMKSQDYQMDANIAIKERFGNVKLFDPTNKTQLNEVIKLLPEKIETTGTWGGDTIPKAEFIDRLQGKQIIKANPDYKTVKIGDTFFDNYSGNDYKVVGKTKTDLLVNDIREINSNNSARQNLPNGFYERYIKNPEKTISEMPSLGKKAKQIAEFKPTVKKIPLNDYIENGEPYWGTFEGSKEFHNILKKLGYDGWKMAEKGSPTYGIFAPEKLQTKSQLTDIWKKAQGESLSVETKRTIEEINKDIEVLTEALKDYPKKSPQFSYITDRIKKLEIEKNSYQEQLGSSQSGTLANFIGKSSKTFSAKEQALFPDKVLKQVINADIKFKPLFENIKQYRVDFNKKSTIDGMFAPDIKKLAAKGDKEAIKSVQFWNGVSLRNLIDYPEFFKAYPSAKNIRVQIGNFNNASGSFFIETNGTPFIRLNPVRSANLKETLKHEIQHYIQAKEGWAKGGSPSDLVNNVDMQGIVLERLRDNLWKDKELLGVTKISDLEYIQNTIDKVKDRGVMMSEKEIQDFFGTREQMTRLASAMYKHLYGEVEASANKIPEIQTENYIFRKSKAGDETTLSLKENTIPLPESKKLPTELKQTQPQPGTKVEALSATELLKPKVNTTYSKTIEQIKTKSQEKVDQIKAQLENIRERIAEHPGKELVKLIDKKEGQFLDFKNPDLQNSEGKFKYNDYQRKLIKEKNKKITMIAESAFEDTKFSGLHDDPDAIREAIDEYNSQKLQEKQYVEQVNKTILEMKTAIKEQKSAEVLEKMYEKLNQQQIKMVEFAEKYPKLAKLTMTMPEEMTTGAIKGYKLGTKEGLAQYKAEQIGLKKLTDMINKELNKPKGLQRSAISFVKELGEFNQTVMTEIKAELGIERPLKEMNLTELRDFTAKLKERLKFKFERGYKPSAETKEKLGVKGKKLPELTEADYAANRAIVKEEKSFKVQAKKTGTYISKGTAKVLAPISTRLGNIDPSLKFALRKFEYDSMTSIQKGKERIQPFLKKIKKLSGPDFKDLDLALKNGDTKKLFELSTKYGMEKEFQIVANTLDDVFKRANEVGFDIGYRKNYFPRVIKDTEGFLEYFGKQEYWSIMQEAIGQKEMYLGRVLTSNEKAELINSMIRGYSGGGITLSGIGNFKERVIDLVTPELNKFYYDSPSALVKYIEGVNDKIAARKFFGKGNKKEGYNNIEDSIGSYTSELLAQGKITPKQELEMRDILNARFNPKGTYGFVGLYKNLAYMDSMGSLLNAVTQLGDQAWAIYRSGLWGTLKADVKALRGKSIIDKKMLGMEVDRVAQEFNDVGRLAKAVDITFKLTGLTKMDRLGKEALVNSAIVKYQKLALNPPKDFTDKINTIFGDEAPQVMEDLKNGLISENVKLLAFNEMLDFAPVALSEMPEMYLKAGNGRIFYMLKSYTLKQFDIFKREAFDEMKKGNWKKGLKNLLRLTFLVMACNGTADEIKDILTGRETKLSDRVIDQIAMLAGFSRFSMGRVSEDGIGTAALKQIAPPVNVYDNLTKDLLAIYKDPKANAKINEIKTVQNIPLIGKFYYWWFGKGSQNTEKYALVDAKLEKMNAIKPVYDEATQLWNEGKEEEAQAIIDNLSDADYELYKQYRTATKAKATIKGKEDILPLYEKIQKASPEEAQTLLDNMTDEEYRLYGLVYKQKQREKLIKEGTKPTYDDGEAQTKQSVIKTVFTYAKAIGVDPITAFDRIFKNQRIDYVTGNTIVIKRNTGTFGNYIPRSTSFREKMKAGETDRLEHIISRELGGSDSESNFEIVSYEQWKENTKIDNFLGKKLRAGEITKKQAQLLVVKFKNGEYTAEDVYNFNK